MRKERKFTKERKSTYKINRFPICAIVHYAVAKRLGYEDNQAKAIGQACAIFYACCKFGYFRNRKKSNKNKSNKSKKISNLTKLQFCDRVFNTTKIDGVLYPVMGDKVITEKDFDKTLNSKLSKEEIDAILSFALNYISQFPEFTLHHPFEIYKRVRDEWRTHEFWNNLMKKYNENVA